MEQKAFEMGMALTDFYELDLRQFFNCLKGYNSRLKQQMTLNAQLAMFTRATIWGKDVKLSDLLKFDDEIEQIQAKEEKPYEERIREIDDFFDKMETAPRVVERVA